MRIASAFKLAAATLTFAFPTLAFAAPIDVTHSGHIRLDQSKNTFFDQFNSYNFSLQLLQAKGQFNKKDLYLGGSGELDLQQWQGNKLVALPMQEYQNGNGFYFTQATLDVMSKLNNQLTTLFLSLTGSYIGGYNPGSNDVFSQHAFLLLGNLNVSPIYVTVGINTIPFGVFSSGVWSMPLTATYFNPQPSPQLSVGYFKNNVNAVITEYEDQVNFQKHTVYSIFYNNNIRSLNYNLGAGYLTNLASNAVGNSLTNRRIRRSLPSSNFGGVFDVNASIGYDIFGFSAEYIDGSKVAGINTDRPKALAFSVTMQPHLFDKVTSFGINHSTSLHLKDIPAVLPGKDGVTSVISGLKNNWGFSVSRSVILENVILGFNVDRAMTYTNEKTYAYTLDLLAYL